jgi:hypothetical protein
VTAATSPLPHTDSTAPDPTVNFSSPRFAFRQLETWLTSDEANGGSEAQVEDQLQQRGRELLRLLLQAHLRQRGTGDVGPALQVYSPPAPAATLEDAGSQAGGIRHGEKRPPDRTLRTTFGEVRVARTAYAAAGRVSIHPLDERLQLPRRSFSYPLQERLVRHAVQGPFDEAVADAERDTGVRLRKDEGGRMKDEKSPRPSHPSSFRLHPSEGRSW